jgi:hypothetical protein
MNNPYDYLIGRKIHLEGWDADIWWFKVDHVKAVTYDKNKIRYELWGIDNLDDNTPVMAANDTLEGLTIVKDFNDHIEEL